MTFTREFADQAAAVMAASEAFDAAFEELDGERLDLLEMADKAGCLGQELIIEVGGVTMKVEIPEDTNEDARFDLSVSRIPCHRFPETA